MRLCQALQTPFSSCFLELLKVGTESHWIGKPGSPRFSLSLPLSPSEFDHFPFFLSTLAGCHVLCISWLWFLSSCSFVILFLSGFSSRTLSPAFLALLVWSTPVLSQLSDIHAGCSPKFTANEVKGHVAFILAAVTFTSFSKGGK